MYIGDILAIFHVLFRHNFQPYRLPDAGGAGVEQAVGIATLALLTAGDEALEAGVIAGYPVVDIKVKLIGGELIINYTDETVYMTGNAEKVFEGEVEG